MLNRSAHYIIEKLKGGWSMRRLVELLPHKWVQVRGLPVELPAHAG